MKKLLALFTVLISVASMNAQGVIKGTVKDNTTGETVIGANIIYAPGKGTVTDIEGNFKLEVPNGSYNIVIQIAGYQSFTKAVKVDGNEVFISVQLQPNIIKEVEVVADIAISRQTPVAFSNVSADKIKEQLGSQDLPMILNTTPGVYATNQGGGDGDARITIRGFSQRNVAVMIDGVPMNDMENGQVYWSNWFGLDNITKTVQVQRGLGASKLAIPSVGGTINIITSGFDAKRSLIFKQEYGNNLTLRSILSYTSGQLKGGWAITAAGSYKRTDGYVESTWSKMWFYYVKVDKKLGDHMLSLSAFGAPQQHGQRSFEQPIGYYSHSLAKDLGVTDAQLVGTPEYGIRYNQHWGNVIRYKDVGDSLNAKKELLSERVNYFHKPVISLRHSWQASDKFFLSNIAYLSFGNGGGTSLNSSTGSPLDGDGHYNFQQTYNDNAYNPLNTFAPGVQRSGAYIRSAVNNHTWYGLLSTFSYHPTTNWNISGGIDLRSYKGEHYRTVYDYIGGDVIIDVADENNPLKVVRKGDKFGYNYDGKVRYGGLFGLAEYKGGNWSAFFNASGATSAYQRVDYFLKKNPDGSYQKTDWKIYPSYTFKGGANYNLTEHMNIYVNSGLFSRAPRFTNVFYNNNIMFTDVRNEHVYAGEIGYSYNSRKFAANVNAYYTVWQNRPVDLTSTVLIDGEQFAVNVNGMNARHTGIEFDGAYKVLKNLTIEGMLSLGDWVWTSKDTVRVNDGNGNVIKSVAFDARNVKVGDAAQVTAATSVRYEPIKRLYFKPQFTYFGKNFASFDPVGLGGPNAGRQSFHLPNYYLLDFHLGYGVSIKKVKLDFRASIFNLLNRLYISDANNNANGSNFDAASADVFVGMGRRFNTSLTITY